MTGVSTNNTKLSIIVPVYNERNTLPFFVNQIQKQWKNEHELIIVDGGSTDGSLEWLKTKKNIKVIRSKKGRAIQMNTGAENDQFDWLYFLHVDSILPLHFDEHIQKAINNGAKTGCFQLEFFPSNWILKLAAAGSKWNHILCRGGDQSLFVKKTLFENLRGSDLDYIVCEDIHFIQKLYQATPFFVLPQKIKTSSRRFTENGCFRLLFHFGVLHFLHWIGSGPKTLNNYYKRVVI